MLGTHNVTCTNKWERKKKTGDENIFPCKFFAMLRVENISKAYAVIC